MDRIWAVLDGVHNAGAPFGPKQLHGNDRACAGTDSLNLCVWESEQKLRIVFASHMLEKGLPVITDLRTIDHREILHR